MNKIEKIGIAGVGPFKKGTTLPIVPGVSVLYGRNELSSGNANAVGKSLIGRIIPSVFYEPEIKADKKQGRRFVIFKSRGEKVKVSLTSGKNEEMTLTVDGEDKSARTKTKTKTAALSRWNISSDEYQTYGLVDAAIPHPLVKGNSSARKAFFTAFFKLDRMDAEKKVFMKELAEIKKMKAAHAEVVAAFDAARRDMVSKEERKALEQEIEELEERVMGLVKRQDKARESQRIQAFIEIAGDKLEALTKRKGKPRPSDELKRAIRKAEQKEEQLNAYKEYLKDRQAYKEATRNLDMSIPMDDLKSAAVLYERLQVKIESLGDLDELDELDKLGKKPRFDGKLPTRDRSELEREHRRIKHALEHSKKFAKGVCETCGQEVKAEDPRELAKRLEKIERELSIWEDFDTYKKDKEKYKKAVEELEGKKRRLKLLKEDARKLKVEARLYEKRRFLVKPERVEKPDLDYDINELRSELELSLFYEQNEDLIEASKTHTPVVFNDRELTKAQERLYKKRARLDLHLAVKKRASQLRDRMAELEKATARQQKLEIILDAYADKAMKKMAIESISAHLMASVNRYAALVFDNYSFEFVWGTQIQILVHRPEGTSDVRMLSGAESMLFTLILILSLLVFVPKSKRLNLLILDEPTASFHQATQDRFVKLLPHINSVIPSVLVITPKTEFKIPGATNFTVVKTPEGSVIKEGHANEI